MIQVRTFSLVSALLLVPLVPAVGTAEWNQDGTPVASSTRAESYVTAISDGAGGAILAWQYDSYPFGEVEAGRIDGSGTALWGALVSSGPSWTRRQPAMVPDGAGGALVAYIDDNLDGTYGVYAQRISAAGVRQWTPAATICNTMAGGREYLRIVEDGAGGAIVSWSDARSGANDIYARRVDASGVPQWTANGVALCAAAGSQNNGVLVSDGASGAILVWTDFRGGASPDVYARRINASGAPQWIADGVGVCTASGYQSSISAAPDGAGGVFVGWGDARGAQPLVYAQRLDAAGTPQWTTNGLQVCTASASQYAPKLLADGAGECFVAWSDYSRGSDIYAQRIDGSGAPQWHAGGIAVGAAAGGQDPWLLSDGTGGAIIGWNDGDDLYAQRLNADGSIQWWPANGVPITRAAGTQSFGVLISLASDGTGGVIAGFHNPTNSTDIYAQRIVGNGTPAFINAEVSSLADLPGDQGGWLRLDLVGAPADAGPGMPEVTGYNLWRRVDPGSSATAGSGRATVEEAEAILARSSFETARLNPAQALAAGFPPGTWESLGFYAATQSTSYLLAVPTRNDSGPTGPAPEVVLVSTHTTSPSVYGVTPPDSASSVDNLAPAPPENSVATPSGDTLYVHWSANGETDLAFYRIYLGPQGMPLEQLVATTAETVWSDPPPWTQPDGQQYWVTAVDRHGNESAPRRVVFASTSVEPPSGFASVLRRPAPNPFGLETTLEYVLGVPGPVRLSIFDASGRRIRILVDGVRPVGGDRVRWNGRDDHGRSVPSGPYWARFTAPGIDQVVRLIRLD